MRVKGKFICKRGGRSFSIAAHLTRHMAASHGQRKAGKVAVLGAKKR